MDRMYRFGGARFWPDQHMLSVHGVPHRLGARAVDLLKMLVESGGELLSKSHLIASIWPGVVVDENNLAVQVANLRKVLGGKAITTVAGRGYRLSEVATFERAAAPADAPPEAGLRRPLPAAQALPHALTRFIGFAAERAQCAQLLRSTRLLTLTGMGGAGKTRLAIELARETQATFADGACFIDLAPLVDPKGLARTVATALGLSEATALSAEDALLRHLREQHCLLVFDNCEHLLPACAALVERLLNAAAKICVLATSRESLGLAGEQIVTMRPMQVPAAPPPHLGPEQLQELLACEAVDLFVGQARQAVAGFALNADNAATVVDICRRLDGIPLALEFAAARVRLMTVQQIADKLDERFRLLTRSSKKPSRHQTLVAMLQWSYEQLNAREQALLQSLSVFSGGCTLAAAAAVADLGDEVEVADLLRTLVDKSLLIVEQIGQAPRYRLLETVRHFARDRLRAAGGEADCMQRHLGHFLRLAQTQDEALTGRAVQPALAVLHAERLNLEAAQAGCDLARDGVALGIDLAIAMRRYWIVSGQYARGRQFFALALARASAEPASRAQALAIFGMAQLWHFSGHVQQASEMADRATAMARALEARKLLVVVLDLCRAVRQRQADLAGARASMEEALALARALDDSYLLGIALLGQGEQQREEGAFEAALQTYQQAHDWMQRHGNVANLGLPARNLASLHAVMGRTGAARAALEEAYEHSELSGVSHRAEQNLSVAARLAAVCGDWPLAARVQGALDRYCDEIGARVAATAACLDDWEDKPRQMLGEQAFALHHQGGRALSLDAVTAEIRQWLRSPWPLPADKPAATAAPVLSPRELQLLDLVARGFNYAEAARCLGLSMSTVRTHARSVFAKLEVHSKTEAVFEARQIGLLG